MRYHAVIFDLFATLVDFSPRAHDQTLLTMASTLAFPHAAFASLWPQVLSLQEQGHHQTVEDSLAYVCQVLNVQADDALIAQEARLYLDFQRGTLMTPRKQAIETLEHLRAAGYKTGLISNCPAVVKFVWPETSLASLIDGAVFSHEVDLRKPDPRIYQAACDRLGVAPHDCLYVGDGGGRELSGAMQVGMHAVLLRVPDEDVEDAQRLGREMWQGTTISTLHEVLLLTGGEAA